MVEIIPNWHPIFVHFTVALLSISSFLFIVSLVLPPNTTVKDKCLTVARWNLYIGSCITIATVIAGLIAYNSVSHDNQSHIAMTDHRNWALVTAFIFFAITAWAIINKKDNHVGKFFACCIALSTILLIITAYKGGELVYRYGLGVMSTPELRNINAKKDYSKESVDLNQRKQLNIPKEVNDDGHNHQH